MSNGVYCNGTFVGRRIFDSSIEVNEGEESELKWTLSFTPTKEYPSVFGAGLNRFGTSLIHGIYDGITREASLTELVDGISRYTYQCQLTIDKSNGQSYLHGRWNSLIDRNQFGKIALVCEVDAPFDILSAIWIGESIPDEELADFYLPINPIRWCAILFRVDTNSWKFFGCGYFNDSADIPDQPLLFFLLHGYGTLDQMTIIKKYTTTDYIVEYRGKFLLDDQFIYQFEGRWSNPLAGSYGSFRAKQCQLNPFISYRLDICICEICRNAIDPGENRWRCFQCHFSTCSACHFHSIATDHPHQLVLDILPDQRVAEGKTTLQFLENALKLFDQNSFLIYRSFQSNEFLSISYGQMSIKCQNLGKYWKKISRE